MNRERLKEIKERLRATTPGVWVVQFPEDECGDTCIMTEDGTYIAQTSYDGLSATTRPTGDADAAFIAHAKKDIEYLLGLLEV